MTQDTINKVKVKNTKKLKDASKKLLILQAAKAKKRFVNSL